MIRELMREISEAVFPSGIYCIHCGCLIDRSRPYSLCDKCIREISWITGVNQKTCSVCGKTLPDTFQGDVCYDCLQTAHYFTKGWSCMTYGLHEREIMMGIKYNNKGYVAVIMGDVMFDRMGTEQDIDLVIPVPVSDRRLVKRGYNQSALMARQFTKRWRMQNQSTAPRCDEHILFRTRETVMLRSLNPAERRLVLEGAFAVKSGTEERIRDKNVLLIDDIYTTGSTADTCSRVLLETGAKNVFLLTLASGGNRRPTE